MIMIIGIILTVIHWEISINLFINSQKLFTVSVVNQEDTRYTIFNETYVIIRY